MFIFARHDPAHHIAGAMMGSSPDSTPNTSPNMNSMANNSQLKLTNEKRYGLDLPGPGPDQGQPRSLWHDVKAMKWMREPGKCLNTSYYIFG